MKPYQLDVKRKDNVCDAKNCKTIKNNYVTIYQISLCFFHSNYLENFEYEN